MRRIPGKYARLVSSSRYRGSGRGRTTRASAMTSTCAAPARLSARAQASSVAPVVNTSSTRSIVLPAIRDAAGARTANAPCILRRRALADGILPWLGVARVRASRRQSTGFPARFPKASARAADWLNRRRHKRQRWSGTGTIKSLSAISSCPTRSSQRAKAGTR